MEENNIKKGRLALRKMSRSGDSQSSIPLKKLSPICKEATELYLTSVGHC